MTTMTKNIDLISRYFDGEMEEWEKIEFRKKLKSDSELKNDYKIFLMVENDLKAMQDEIDILSQSDYEKAEKIASETVFEYEPESEKAHSIKSFISKPENKLTIGKKIKSGTKGNHRLTIYVLAIAASLIIGFIILNALVFKTDPDRLFTEYYALPQLATDLTRNAITSESDQVNEAIILLSEGVVDEAELVLNELLNSNEVTPRILFLCSIAKIENGNFHEASALLLDTRLTNSEYEPEAIWYHSLLQLKIGPPEDAKSLFLELSKVPGKYQDEALDILSALRKIK